MDQTAELSFKIRQPFVVRRERVMPRPDGRGRERITDRFFSGDLVGLIADEVRLHAHALEPTDDASAAALAELHYTPKPAPPEGPLSPEIIARVHAVIDAALAALATSA